MLDLILSAAIFLVATVWFWQKHCSKPADLPPGPPRLPIIGSGKLLPEEVKKGKKRMQIYMQEKYGPISSIYVGTRPLIFLSDLGLIKELYKQLEASGRPNNKPFHEIRFGSEDGTQRGLLASTGKEWQEQRRFTMRQLRDLGFGKSSMEDAINDEVEKLVKLLEEDNGKEISLNLKMNLSIVNALWVLLTDEKLPLDDPKLKDIVTKFDQLLRAESRETPLQMVVRYFSPTLSKHFNGSFKKFRSVFNDIFDLVRVHLKDHKESLDPDNPRDFMDTYLTEIGKTNDATSSFYKKKGEESLLAVMGDLFLAGAETTSSSLLWAFLFLLHYPDVQERVQAEIDEVVGQNRKVSLEDKVSLPYTNAVLMESMRMATIVPMALPHTATSDLEIGGYKIPKDATMFANILHVHYDPSYWNEPDKFDPTRFYDETTKTFRNDDHLIPFSVGKRYCLGQSLAEKEYFLFFTGLLQKFSFLPKNEGKDLPKIGKNSGIAIGILRSAPLYECILKKRTADDKVESTNL